MKTSRRALLGSVPAVVLLAAPALSQESWPRREAIRAIVPYPPGAGTDMMVRGMAPHLERAIPGSRIAVINRPGATAELGHAAIAQAAPDGYTYGIVVTPSLQTVTIERVARYGMDDFAFLAGISEDPGAFVVRSESPLRTLADLMAHVRANPDRVSVGTAGVGSDDHLLMLEFAQKLGAPMVHVPFPGVAPVMTALVGGHIDVAAMNVAEALQGIAGGRFRCLAQAAEQRIPMAPDIPTFRELGLDMVSGITRGYAMPSQTPASIAGQMTKAIEAVMQDGAWQADAERLSLPLRYWDPAAYRRIVTEQDAMLRRRWQAAPWAN
ncbi:MAG: 3-phosphoglycerate dehydrogenase [Rubritepida sp.]|nr:3-phosphoglycerate dehydrogenase [Rubritepida sp.]